ncbi:MAG: bile acid:sodium symporter [Candidatus Eremiobacteraeota bacterium]|nr:bile acid:sodium symporter [Candidatus Eremiobacteraeota bacterium]
MEHLYDLLSCIFFASAMLSIGITVTGGQIIASLKDYRLGARVLLANLVLVPGLGLLLVRLFQLSVDNTLGILFMACAPGGLNAIEFTGRIRSHLASAAGILFLLNVAALAFTPLLIHVLISCPMLVTLPYLQIVLFLVLGLLVPLLCGCVIYRRWPSFSDRIRRPLVLTADVSFLAIMLITLVIKKKATHLVGDATLLVIVLLTLGSLAIGWILGGRDGEMKKILAATTSMRNAALSLLIAVAGFSMRDMDVAIVASAAVMFTLNKLFFLALRLKDRKKGKNSEPS